MSQTFIVDMDDFCEPNNDLHLLFQLRARRPGFKVNLFTVPGRCTFSFLQEVRKLDWIDMIPHGWLHPTPRECEHWTYEQSVDYLDWLEDQGYTRGWKAPGWMISQPMYQALQEFGYWIADQAYNNHRRPPGLRAYILDSPNKIHGHIGNWGGQNANALELIFDQVAALRGEFKFIKEVL